MAGKKQAVPVAFASKLPSQGHVAWPRQLVPFFFFFFFFFKHTDWLYCGHAGMPLPRARVESNDDDIPCPAGKAKPHVRAQTECRAQNEKSRELTKFSSHSGSGHQ